MISFATLDNLLSAVNKSVEFRTGADYRKGGEWVWCEKTTDGEIVIHGSPYYRRETAYEDALRDSLGIVPIADEALQQS